jgi:hypothetical protein
MHVHVRFAVAVVLQLTTNHSLVLCAQLVVCQSWHRDKAAFLLHQGFNSVGD